MLKLFTILFLCGFLSSCGHFKKIKEAKKAAEAVAGAKPLITLPKSDFKPTIELDGPTELPAPAPAKDSTLVDVDTKNTFKAGELYEAVKDVTLKRADNIIKERLSSNTTISRGQTWLFYALGAGFIIAGAVLGWGMKSKEIFLWGGVGALCMFFAPTLIEALHEITATIVLGFKICFGVGIALLIGRVLWKVFHHEAKPKPLKVEK